MTRLSIRTQHVSYDNHLQGLEQKSKWLYNIKVIREESQSNKIILKGGKCYV
jgi:hypothetical protein|nr:MAG TPA: hypothetical protein [Caudoviricetes sp.]